MIPSLVLYTLRSGYLPSFSIVLPSYSRLPAPLVCDDQRRASPFDLLLYSTEWHMVPRYELSTDEMMSVVYFGPPLEQHCPAAMLNDT